MNDSRFSNRELERYSRQIMIEGFGEDGQRKLAEATIGIMGQGGLGSPVSTYLAAAGVGRLILVDYQIPDISNLNRQVLHWEEDVEKRTPKVQSAAWKLTRLNSSIEVIPKMVKVTDENIDSVFEGADLIIDCLDDFTPRYMLNDYCIRKKMPLIHGAVEGFHGQITTIIPGETPCLRCLFPKPPPKKGIFPIIGVTAGIFGILEAAEAIKLITHLGEPLKSKLLIGDLLYQYWEAIEVCRTDKCPVCSHL
ncbi:MAG: ThiF family adenylyltransferase [Methanomassiliicoccales archaeon]